MQECFLELCTFMCKKKNIKDMKLNIKHTRIFPSNTGLHDMCDNYLFMHVKKIVCNLHVKLLLAHK